MVDDGNSTSRKIVINIHTDVDATKTHISVFIIPEVRSSQNRCDIFRAFKKKLLPSRKFYSFNTACIEDHKNRIKWYRDPGVRRTVSICPV